MFKVNYAVILTKSQKKKKQFLVFSEVQDRHPNTKAVLLDKTKELYLLLCFSFYSPCTGC